MSFSNILIQWYLQNKRDLPWRKTQNPYHIWLSEIILQQTRVNQGMEYYQNFISNFPTIFDLAKADQQLVLKLWQGLGYYSRARNLHYSANYVVDILNGKFPQTYKGLLNLKGIGDYTASAIASICYNEATAVVDGNVYRVLARIFGISTPIDSSKGIKDFKKLAQQLIDKEQPGIFNQALMEFGAIQCKPRNPDCGNCPLNTGCYALQKRAIEKFPVKEKKIKIKKRYFNYIVITNQNDETVIKRRINKGIWQGLYEFPLIETPFEFHLKELMNTPEFNHIVKDEKGTLSLFNKTPIVHKLSHQHLHTKFWVLITKKEINNSVLWNDFNDYPVPTLIHNFVREFKKKA